MSERTHSNRSRTEVREPELFCGANASFQKKYCETKNQWGSDTPKSLDPLEGHQTELFFFRFFSLSSFFWEQGWREQLHSFADDQQMHHNIDTA